MIITYQHIKNGSKEAFLLIITRKDQQKGTITTIYKLELSARSSADSEAFMMSETFIMLEVTGGRTIA